MEDQPAMKAFSILVFLCLTLGAALSASGSNSEVRGSIEDEETGLPVPGAYVIGRWVYAGSDGYGSRSVCTGLEVVRTDLQGRFSLRQARPLKEFRNMNVFVPGKELVRKPFSATGPVILKVRTFAGESRERIFQFQQLYSNVFCGHLPGTYGKLRPLLAAIDEEAANLPGLTPDEYRPGRFSRSLSQLEQRIKAEK